FRSPPCSSGIGSSVHRSAPGIHTYLRDRSTSLPPFGHRASPLPQKPFPNTRSRRNPPCLPVRRTDAAPATLLLDYVPKFESVARPVTQTILHSVRRSSP